MKTYNIPSLIDVQAEKYRRSLAEFVKRAWQEVDPAPLVWNWHLQAICDHIQALDEGKIRKLLINVPPGSAKSLIAAVCRPAWRWASDPTWSSFLATYAESLAQDQRLKGRRLIESAWYQRHFVRGAWSLMADQNTVLLFSNTRMGRLMGAGVTGLGTGYRAGDITFDDTLKAADATSVIKKTELETWHTGTMKTRVNNPKTATLLGICQRLAEDDWSGRRLAEGGWVHLRIPMTYEKNPNCRCATCAAGVTPIGWRDPRTEEGELMFPARWGEEEIDDLKKDPVIFATQQQQDPTAGGVGFVEHGHFNQVWIREDEPHLPSAVSCMETTVDWRVEIFREDPAESTLQQPWDDMIMVVDATFKDTKRSDLVCIGVFGKRKANVYLLDLWWQRASITLTMTAIRTLAERWPLVTAKLVEDKANGSAIISLLKDEIPGIVGVNPGSSSKESRFQAVVPYIVSGNFRLPLHAPWRGEFVRHLVGFPRMAKDDPVDVTAYALTYLLTGKKSNSFEELANIPVI
jgi:predicted phage terminase large subunit-like protein